ncbi:MAG TPA: cupredoxin domain-containing protein [Gemmataceae bacterium]|nr:cupredoxin domain-containing protein [Gemmataceae bacterium]
METDQVVVTVGGALLVGFILWFFFGPRAATTARSAAGGVQEARIEVRGAYSPDRIEVEAGRPVRLTFVRREANSCTEQVIFPDFGIVQELPVGRTVPVEFTPDRPGEFPFHCGMNMVRGRLVVKARAAGSS